jgi:hypothetical protein
MTPIVQLRKEPRAVATPEGQFRRTSQIPTARIPPSLLKILGLNPRPESLE